MISRRASLPALQELERLTLGPSVCKAWASPYPTPKRQGYTVVILEDVLRGHFVCTITQLAKHVRNMGVACSLQLNGRG